MAPRFLTTEAEDMVMPSRVTVSENLRSKTSGFRSKKRQVT